MNAFWKRRRNGRDVEAVMHTHGPEPRADFVRSLATRVRGEATRRNRPISFRLAIAAALTAMMLVVLASTGGLSYAMSASGDAVEVLRDVIDPSAPARVIIGPAADEYGGNACGTPRKPCRISIKNQKVREGNLGTTPMVFTLTLSASPITLPVTVEYATVNNTATGGVDYVPSAGTVTFAPGETRKFIVISIVGDVLPEPNETFFVNLFNPSPNSEIADGQAVGTIVDDD